MAFVKGKSGNPSGRPKVVGAIRDMARLHADDAVGTLVKIMKGNEHPPAARVAAAKELLDRGFGKAPQPMDGDGDGGPIKITIGWLGNSS